MTENASTETQATEPITTAEAVETVTEKIVTDVKDEAAEAFAKLVAEEEKIVQEAQQIAHVVVEEVKQAVTHVEVAAENVVRKVIDVVIGTSRIKNPA